MGMMIHRAKMRQVRKAMYEPVVEEPMEETYEVEQPEENIKEEKKEVEYTIDEINSLPFFSLKSVATRYGIDVKGKKAAELRADLIQKLEL